MVGRGSLSTTGNKEKLNAEAVCSHFSRGLMARLHKKVNEGVDVDGDWCNAMSCPLTFVANRRTRFGKKFVRNLAASQSRKNKRVMIRSLYIQNSSVVAVILNCRNVIEFESMNRTPAVSRTS